MFESEYLMGKEELKEVYQKTNKDHLDYLKIDFNQRLAELMLNSRYGWEILDYDPQYGVENYNANPHYQGTMDIEYLQQRHWYTQRAKKQVQRLLDLHYMNPNKTT